MLRRGTVWDRSRLMPRPVSRTTRSIASPGEGRSGESGTAAPSGCTATAPAIAQPRYRLGLELLDLMELPHKGREAGPRDPVPLSRGGACFR
eukprot:8630530-Alexandrium_andersonii.AAC.1